MVLTISPLLVMPLVNDMNTQQISLDFKQAFSDEDNTESSLPPLPLSHSHSLTKEELIPSAKRQRHLGPFVSSTSEEESDANAVAALPEGIEEQYGFKINPVSHFLVSMVTKTLH